MLRDNLYRLMTRQRLTMLGVGPMSKNCVDVAIELAGAHKIPLMLIASRRQIECQALGGGYVENWSTEAFVDYVKSNDKEGNIILCRDHGGPWQHPSEAKMGLSEAMASAKKSYSVDIESGMQIIHIDPSIDPNGEPSMPQLVDRVLELYSHCWDVAQKHGRDIAFEVGTEEQIAGLNTAAEFSAVLNAIQNGCRKLHLPQPLFIVGQTGTKVMERRNIGRFEEVSGNPTELKALLEICKRHEILLKEHNTDYLGEHALSLHPALGVHAANVAPEFGVVETMAFIQLAEQLGCASIADRFLELAYKSRKWEKWMLPDTHATDRERAIICGHYVFAKDEFKELRHQLDFAARAKKTNVDECLKQALSASMTRYLMNFGLIHEPMKIAV